MKELSEEKNSGDEDIRSKLEALYARVPGWEVILRQVRKGEKEFVGELRKRGLDRLGVHTSRVHSYSDIEVQAFIVGIPSQEFPEEIATKSFWVHGAHWLDDFFDNPELVIDAPKMTENRHDIHKILRGMGDIGAIGSTMAQKTAHPEGVYKGLHRMAYGGMIQRSPSQEERRRLVQEYGALGVRGIREDLAEEIKTIQPEAYLMTNKVVMEFMNSAEEEFDFSLHEAWNLIYAPALFYHDVGEEAETGELNFSTEEMPRLSEMLKMMRIGKKHLGIIGDARRSLRIDQLRFLLGAFQSVLPQEIISEYQDIIHQFQK